MPKDLKKVLSVFSLIMINVIAVDSLRALPFGAIYGANLIFFYAIGALFFMLPVALITSELATTWPKNGGIYIWSTEAFGEKIGFLVSWLQWIYNLVWYPSILGLVAAIISYIINPNLEQNKFFITTVVLGVFWLATFANCFGMRVSSLLSSIGSIFGTLLPMTVITFLGASWLISGNQSEISFGVTDIVPSIGSINELALVSTILFSLMGLEMSAVHAQEVKNPQRDFPRAITWSVLIIITSLVLSSLAIAVVVPKQEISLATGLLQAFEVFLSKLGLRYLMPVLAFLMILGSVGGIAAWIIGPTKAMLAAAQNTNLPAMLKETNKNGVPVNILILQGIIVTILSLVYIYMPNFTEAYVYLSQLTSILALLMYSLFFAAGIKLRYKQKDIHRPFKVPFGNIGIWICGILGVIMCLIGICLGLLAPEQILISNKSQYTSLLVIGTLAFCLPSILVRRNRKK